MRRTTAVAAGIAHLVGPGQLKVINGHLAFSSPKQSPLRLDPTALSAVYCYGDVTVTGAAIDLLLRLRTHTAWFTPAGHRCRGQILRADPSSTLTRMRQHAAFGQVAARLEWAKVVVAGKIESMIIAARHYQRHGAVAAGALMARLSSLVERLPAVAAVDQLLGLEGSASAAWFEFLGGLLQPPWSFSTRSRRPPTDPFNAMLSLAYTWLTTRAGARAEARGLEVYLGGLHEYRPGRPSLACDLVEPLRVPAVDRWALAAANQGELTPDVFRPDENGGFRLQPRWFGRTLQSWETHWVNGGQEGELERWLDRLEATLKRWDGLPPGAEASAADL